MDPEKSAPPAYQYEAMNVTTTQPVPPNQGQPHLYPNPNVTTATTTVYQAAVVQQPLPAMSGGLRPGMQSYRNWSSELCSCFDDMVSCMLVTFCPTFFMFYMYSKYDEFMCAPLCLPVSVALLRGKHRHRHGIHGSICNDVCTDIWCSLCAICQLKRDMDFVEKSGLVL
jgi:Cys-rich protein (TIGR01571 family)